MVRGPFLFGLLEMAVEITITVTAMDIPTPSIVCRFPASLSTVTCLGTVKLAVLP